MKPKSRLPMIGAALTVGFTVIAGAVAALDYIHGLEAQQRDYAAKGALLAYRLDEAERDIQEVKTKEQHDIDLVRCK